MGRQLLVVLGQNWKLESWISWGLTNQNGDLIMKKTCDLFFFKWTLGVSENGTCPETGMLTGRMMINPWMEWGMEF
jgi:hypothetical protein